MKRAAFIILGIVLVTTAVFAQRRFRGGFGRGGGWYSAYETCRTAREVPSHSTGTPNWTNAPGFEKDVFTFVRIRRDDARQDGQYCSPTAGQWWTDFPDSDLNLSFRLQQVTSLKVDPDGRVLRLSDPALFDYPFIYMVEPGSLQLRDDEVPILRKYLLNGGVLMADDFWGPVQWNTFASQIKRVFPKRDWVELPMTRTNALFHCVFDLKGPISNLQTPNIDQGIRSRGDGVTWEYHDGVACRDMHLRAIKDDKGHIMVLASFNCDNGDGWEREGENDYFFHEFSEKRAYPLGFNIIFYLMTH